MPPVLKSYAILYFLQQKTFQTLVLIILIIASQQLFFFFKCMLIQSKETNYGEFKLATVYLRIYLEEKWLSTSSYIPLTLSP